MRRGAVVEVLMDNFLLVTKTFEDHLQLLELWFPYNTKRFIYFKRSKCELACKELMVLGRPVGDGRRGPILEEGTKIAA